MIKSISYIIKRIVIGVCIALILMAIKGKLFLLANASTLNISSAEICSQGYGCTSGTTLPISQSYGKVVYTYFPSVSGLVNTHFYSFNFYAIVKAKDLTIDSGYPTIFSCNSGGNCVRAYPDRYETLYINYIGADRYAINWSFDMEIISNSYNTFNISFYYTSTYTSLFTQSTLESVSLDLNDVTGGSGSSNDDIINNSNSNTQNIINNNNSNTQNIINSNEENTTNIINNNNTNTQEIIDNQNANTDKEIESQKVCSLYDSSSIIFPSRFLNADGTLSSTSNSGVTDFINIDSNSSLYILNPYSSGNYRYCFYNINKNFISCSISTTLSDNESISIPNNASFVRFTINSANNRPQYRICRNGNQAIADSINDDNVDNATNEASSFFDNFQSNSHGLSGIITSPLRLITSLASSQCSPLVLPLPFVDQSATLPCMSTVYSNFPTFYSLWQLISTGLIAYYILIKLFGHIKGMQNPNDDRIEVLNL